MLALRKKILNQDAEQEQCIIEITLEKNSENPWNKINLPKRQQCIKYYFFLLFFLFFSEIVSLIRLYSFLFFCTGRFFLNKWKKSTKLNYAQFYF